MNYLERLNKFTYLNIIKKYPETQKDILELRRIKNQSIIIELIISFLVGLVIGVLL